MLTSTSVKPGPEGDLVVDGDFTGSWQAIRYSEEHLMLSRQSVSYDSTLGCCSAEILKSVVLGLASSFFSGSLSVRVKDQLKTIIFSHGQLIFARSDLIDDRLGEVMYRAGLITLEQMTDAAVQVTRDLKFGKVLMQSQFLNSADLWEALKIQVLEIFQSIFLSDTVHFLVRDRSEMPPISIIFDRTTEELTESCTSFGQMFRSFLSRISGTSAITVIAEKNQQDFPQQGTFEGDVLELVEMSSSIESLLNKSKLSKTNTYLSIFNLVMKRILNVEDAPVSGPKISRRALIGRRELKSLIDAYHVVLSEATKAFQTAGVSFPVADLNEFLSRKYLAKKSPLFLDRDGAIAPVSVRHFYAKSSCSEQQQADSARDLNGLIQFVLQIIGDTIPKEGRDIKNSLQEMLE